jgi:hypothetical protein
LKFFVGKRNKSLKKSNGYADTLAKAGCVQYSDFLLYTSALAHVLDALDFDISVATRSRFVFV